MNHFKTRLAFRAICAFTVGILAIACDDAPTEPEPIATVETIQAAKVAEDGVPVVDATWQSGGSLSGALADLTERIIPALPRNSATLELADAITELQTAVNLDTGLDTGLDSGARVERVMIALQAIAATPNGRDAAADLEVARLAIEQAIPLIEPAARTRLSTRLFTKTLIIPEAE